jgi:hypothetical protein
MAEITLPRYIITQMLMPAGRRTAPKPMLVYARPAYAPIAQFKGWKPKDEHGVFENWEYRFWARATWGKELTGHLTECRACLATANESRESRTAHHVGGCCGRLAKAYALLLRDKKCVICDCKTTSAKWGVPLCSSGCEQSWCEVEAQPLPLAFALKLVTDKET